jgi:hypothetical protein
MLFSTDMASANMQGRKTQTRRTRGLKMLNENPDNWIVGKEYESKKDGELYFPVFSKTDPELRMRIKSPYGRKGDVMWMRETWCYVMFDHAHDLLEGSRSKTQYVYRDSFHSDWMEYAKEKYGYRWYPSIHMPREACRFEAVIKDVRLERLWDITEEECIAEGLTTTLREHDAVVHLQLQWQELWTEVNGPESWLANPWVWVVEYVNPFKKYEECNTL